VRHRHPGVTDQSIDFARLHLDSQRTDNPSCSYAKETRCNRKSRQTRQPTPHRGAPALVHRVGLVNLRATLRQPLVRPADTAPDDFISPSLMGNSCNCHPFNRDLVKKHRRTHLYSHYRRITCVETALDLAAATTVNSAIGLDRPVGHRKQATSTLQCDLEQQENNHKHRDSGCIKICLDLRREANRSFSTFTHRPPWLNCTVLGKLTTCCSIGE